MKNTVRRKPSFFASLRPRKMKKLIFTVLMRDIDNVIEYLGRNPIMHFTEEKTQEHVSETGSIRQTKDKIHEVLTSLALVIPHEPEADSRVPEESEIKLADKLCDDFFVLIKQEDDLNQERLKINDTLTEARAFGNFNAYFKDMDQLSYLTIRFGRLELSEQKKLKESLGGRAIVISLDGETGGDRILAASSRKGRFALDTELKRHNFAPMVVSESYKGIPVEVIEGLESRIESIDRELEEAIQKKESFKTKYGLELESIYANLIMAELIEDLKKRFVSTSSAYLLSGWVPADALPELIKELEEITNGRIAVSSFNPEDVPGVREGKEKVPVSLKHGSFVKGFEGVVFSFAAPLYGTIDPTFFVAISFTILFGIMFGDLGQGFVMFLAGVLCGKRKKGFFAKFKKFSVPLIAVGISSMIMGVLNGEVFTNAELLIRPTLAVTEFLFNYPMERILTIMPLPAHGGSVTKLFIFFGFTISVGVLIISLGLFTNIVNHLALKNYQDAFFSKTGLAGAVFFLYAISIALRFLFAETGRGEFKLYTIDAIFLIVPVTVIFLGPAIWRLLSRKRPVFREGVMVFIMEGLVEILETISTYVSSTVSFLRVGAFALSHAVLSFIVFFFVERISGVTAGTVYSVIILILGNSIIILLEGMIVAIQVMRLQYYEFFSKFFTAAGVEFSPFRFRKGAL